MTLRISGKNFDVGKSLRDYAEGRIGESVLKYFDGGFSGHVTVEKEGSGFRTDCSIHLDTGIVLQASGTAKEPYPSFDQAAERIEKRLRRYKRRLKSHRGPSTHETFAIDRVLQSPEVHDEVPEDFMPAVIAETTTAIRSHTVGSAVMELDMSDAPAVVFRNAKSGTLNVVFRRPDGHVGWIDPDLTNAST
ncbi:MAG: ribosome-associated translation inhibitor RaiA [Cohaesibacteraceae bacterium]|nr:ribosome-associated translation inhibitor RaiA [Cohaesibacteraceae bacterium]